MPGVVVKLGNPGLFGIGLNGAVGRSEQIDVAFGFDFIRIQDVKQPRGIAAASRILQKQGIIKIRLFPDRETALHLTEPTITADVAIVATLRNPNAVTVPVLLLADAARQWGAERVGLIAPYLPYMRQDTEFHPGDAVTARSYGTLLSRSFNWLVTIDPHLHRIGRLSQIFSIPARSIHAAYAIGRWIAANVNKPFIIGPDRESRQWAEAVATAAYAPVLVLDKTRRGDAEVLLSAPDLAQYEGRTPVLVDDIVSTGETLAAAVRLVRDRSAIAPICAVVHAVFADGAYLKLVEAGASLVATTNTISHFTNRLDVVPLLAAAVSRRKQVVETGVACHAHLMR
jgi:ribose-phosphate pyrophosphokinase